MADTADAAIEPGRYTAPRLNPLAAAAAAAIADGLIAAVAWIEPGMRPVHKVERRLIVLNLAPPPAASVKPVPPKVAPAKRAVVITPVPLVAVPIPSLPAAAPVVSPPAPPPEKPTLPTSMAPIPTAPPRPPAPVIVADLSATMISARPPDYPVMSRRNREQGTVILRVTLAVDGTVDTVSVERSSGVERLDKAALAAVKHWRWSPTVRDGRPVSVSGIVRLPFVLRT